MRRRSSGSTRNRPSLNVRSPNEVDAERVSADVAIIGSGAAGSVLAQRLLEAGRQVTVLEGGRHVDPRDFSEDERVQFSTLFSDGGMQMSTRRALPGAAGASASAAAPSINNAVCFDLPDTSLERWNDPDGLDAGIDPDRLAAVVRKRCARSSRSRARRTRRSSAAA